MPKSLSESKNIAQARKKLVYYSSLISKNNLTYASFGNISLRLSDKILLKNKGANLESAKESDFSIFSLQASGKNLLKNKNLSSEWKMHYLIYEKNISIVSVLHLHPFYISLIDELGLELASQDLEFQYILKGRVGKLEAYQPGSDKLAKEAAKAVAKAPLLILNKHGIISAAQDIQSAYNLALSAEVCAKRMIHLRLFGQL